MSYSRRPFHRRAPASVIKLPRIQHAVLPAFTLLLLLAVPALGADGEKSQLDIPAEGPARAAAQGGGGGLVRTLFGLAIVVGVIYGLYWVLKQVRAAREERASGTGLNAVATLPLGPNRSLHLVRAGGELVLVGVAEHGVTPIRSWSEHEARALGLLDGDGDGDGARGGPAARAAGAAGANSGAPAPLKLRKLVEELRARTVIG